MKKEQLQPGMPGEARDHGLSGPRPYPMCPRCELSCCVEPCPNVGQLPAWRCDFCGLEFIVFAGLGSKKSEAALIAGGQGRGADSVKAAAIGLLVAVTVGVFAAIVLWLMGY